MIDFDKYDKEDLMILLEVYLEINMDQNKLINELCNENLSLKRTVQELEYYKTIYWKPGQGNIEL